MIFFINDTVSRIARSHIYYPKRISECVELPYGLLYYDTGTPSSHMCNHAVITDLTGDLSDKIYQVTEFYLRMDLTPVIYTSFSKNAYRIMDQPLRTCGYATGKYPEGGFFYYRGCKADRYYNPAGNIHRVVRPDERIEQMFSDDEEGVYNRTVIRKLLPREKYYLWALYEEGKPVSVASVVMMDEYKTSVIDNVYTARGYRNKGYATAVVRHAVRMHREISDNLVFLYAYKEQPIRIYQSIGFAKVDDTRLEYWNAWLEP